MYNGTTFEADLPIRYWYDFSRKFDGIIKPAFDSMIMFTAITATRSGLYEKVHLELYNFFDPRSPEIIDQFFLPQDDSIYFYIRSAIQLKSGKWLVFLTKDDIGYYCLTDRLIMKKVPF